MLGGIRFVQHYRRVRLLAETKTVVLVDGRRARCLTRSRGRGFTVIANERPETYTIYEAHAGDVRTRSVKRSAAECRSGGVTTLASQPSGDIANVGQPPPAESAPATGRRHTTKRDSECGNVP
jgi:hypothetical protein